jgi:regulatory protein
LPFLTMSGKTSSVSHGMDDVNEKLTGLKTILTKAQSYCAYRDRCSAEVIQKLRDWGVDQTRIPKIVESLTEDKFLDDRRYAESFAGSKFRLKHWGRNKIAYELRLKKIPSGLISEALESIDETEYATTLQTLITKKSKEVKDPDAYRKKQKIARYLISKGFEAELVFANLKS